MAIVFQRTKEKSTQRWLDYPGQDSDKSLVKELNSGRFSLLETTRICKALFVMTSLCRKHLQGERFFMWWIHLSVE